MGKSRNRLGTGATKEEQDQLASEYHKILASMQEKAPGLSLLDEFLREGAGVGVEKVFGILTPLPSFIVTTDATSLLTKVIIPGLVLVGADLYLGADGYDRIRKTIQQRMRCCSHTITNRQNVTLALLGKVFKIDESALGPEDILDPQSLFKKLSSPSEDRVSAFLRSMLSPETQRLLPAHADHGDPHLLEMLANDLNRVIHGELLYDRELFSSVHLSPLTESLLSHIARKQDFSRVNRALLEDAWPEIAKTNPVYHRLKENNQPLRAFSIQACCDWLAEQAISTYNGLCIEVDLIPPNEVRPNSVVCHLNNQLKKLDVEGQEQAIAGILKEHPEFAVPTSSQDWIEQGRRLYEGLRGGEKAALTEGAVQLVAEWKPSQPEAQQADNSPEASPDAHSGSEGRDIGASSTSSEPPPPQSFEDLVERCRISMAKDPTERARQLAKLKALIDSELPPGRTLESVCDEWLSMLAEQPDEFKWRTVMELHGKLKTVLQANGWTVVAAQLNAVLPTLSPADAGDLAEFLRGIVAQCPKQMNFAEEFLAERESPV